MFNIYEFKFLMKKEKKAISFFKINIIFLLFYWKILFASNERGNIQLVKNRDLAPITIS